MTVYQMMQSECIVSIVPRGVKAEAIKNTLAGEVSNMVPGTMLKTHKDWNLWIDSDSAAGFLKY